MSSLCRSVTERIYKKDKTLKKQLPTLMTLLLLMKYSRTDLIIFLALFKRLTPTLTTSRSNSNMLL